MSYRLIVRPEARIDTFEASEWDHEQRPGLGAEFLAAIRDCLPSLMTNPLLHRVRARYRRREVRWMYPERFPYRVIYFVDGLSVTIFAVLHAKRSDAAWKERIKQRDEPTP